MTTPQLQGKLVNVVYQRAQGEGQADGVNFAVLPQTYMKMIYALQSHRCFGWKCTSFVLRLHILETLIILEHGLTNLHLIKQRTVFRMFIIPSIVRCI